MKIKIKNSTFNKTAQTVTFTDYATIKLESVLLVTNVTRNKIIYNFTNPTLWGTVAGNVLTLAYDTSAMANGDKLMIMYEDDAQNVWDKLVSMMSDFTSWWNTATGWYAEVVQARDTARNITDTKWIPALDKINNGLLEATIKNTELQVWLKSYDKLNMLLSKILPMLRVLNITAWNGNTRLSVDLATLQNVAVNTARIWNLTTLDSMTNQVLSGWVSNFNIAYSQSKVAYQQTMRSKLTFTK